MSAVLGLLGSAVSRLLHSSPSPESLSAKYAADNEELWPHRRRMMVLLAALAYAAWFVYSRRAAHHGRLWGPWWAAWFGGWVCKAIATACGLKLDVQFEDKEGLHAEHRGLQLKQR